jgi:hypothetical protein
MDAEYVRLFSESMWPSGGELAPDPPARTDEQKLQMRVEAKSKLIGSLGSALKGIVGKDSCRQGATRLFEALQHGRLNKRFFYVFLECLLVRAPRAGAA